MNGTDNPWLLDRNYTLGWLVLAGLVVLAVVVGGLVLRSRRRNTPPPREQEVPVSGGDGH